MTIITLTTDFGQADGYAGAMKGVILGIAPAARLVDLSHEIAPQDVRQAAFVLERAVPFFPQGTVHLAVVDPGVGSERRPLVVMTPQALFVGPDNGLFTFALAMPGSSAWEPDRPALWLPDPSATFHGRDLFAPVAAHLAEGMPVRELARPLTDPVRLERVLPERRPGGSISGHIVHVDRFGNLISDISAAWLAPHGHRWSCTIGSVRIAGLSPSYAAAERGALLALVGSGSTLEIAVRDGSAAQRLDARAGCALELEPLP